MNLEAIFPLVLVVLFVGHILVEVARPARPLPRVAAWRWKGVLSFVMAAAVSGGTPLIYGDFFVKHRLIDSSWLGTIGGALLALVVSEFFNYWLHRSSHHTILWRAYHQVHHSAERIDIYGSAFIHPLELVVSGILGAFASTMLVGVTPNAAALAGMAGIFLAMFQHLNVKTPTWLGYVIQRPESHSVHHRRGHHASNYANLPVYDILFGTFDNPEIFATEAGFYPGASSRFFEMLFFFDVSEPKEAVTPQSTRLSAQS